MQKDLLGQNIQTNSEHENSCSTNHLLLLCDFSGKIIFSKGDPKVLGLPSSSYLHSNFFSFNFTLHSRLALTARLNYEIYKEGHREQFQLELVNQDPKSIYTPSSRTRKLSIKRLRELLFKQIKLLNVTVSCVQVTFKKINDVSKKTCEVESFSIQKAKDLFDCFEDYDKLLMFEIDCDIDKKDKTYEIFNLNSAKIHQRLIDIHYCLNHTVYNAGRYGKGISGAFSLYSFEDIPLPVKKGYEREEDRYLDLNEQLKEGYFLRSKKKVKLNEEEREQTYVQQFLEENEFLDMDSKS